MNEIIGVMDGLCGLSILGAMLFSSTVCRCPITHKIGLWIIAMGMMYQSLRHLKPEHFSDNVLMAFVHAALWLALGIITVVILANRRRLARQS